MDNLQISLIIAIIIIAIVLIFLVGKQPEKVKKWLLYAVSNAERELGGGTGPLKLGQVYDDFVSKYPILKIFVSFETFKGWVKIALIEMEKLLVEKEAVKEVVRPDVPEIDVENSIL